MTRGPLVIEELLAPGEAAALAGVSTTTIARWVDGGRLSGVRTPGRHRRVKTAELMELIELRRLGRLR